MGVTAAVDPDEDGEENGRGGEDTGDDSGDGGTTTGSVTGGSVDGEVEAVFGLVLRVGVEDRVYGLVTVRRGDRRIQHTEPGAWRSRRSETENAERGSGVG